MKYCGFALAFLIGVLTPAWAQVTAEVTLDQEQFLLGEAIPATVRITNLSGQTLHLGADPDWLTFSVASPEGFVVSKTDNPPVLGEFTLESSKVAIKHVEVGPYFVFSHAGRYGITATVRIKSWGQEISSRPKMFDIIDGARIWQQEVGIPRPPGASNSIPELRRYVLQQANYIRGQLRLYLRVTDGYGKAMRVSAIGPMVSFGRPDPPQVDKLSNLHVLYQNGPTSFSYTVYDPNGELLLRQIYDYINTRPRLRADLEGNIMVTGGARRVTPNDIPSSKDSDGTSAPPGNAVNSRTNPPAR